MANYNALFPSPDNPHLSLRQADGKALGRVRAIVKGSAPQAGMKDYRFFVDPVSPLPKGFEEAEKFGFTGFMSRIGFGFNSFQTEEQALAKLMEEYGDSFVTFTPALRSNKFFVLDDMTKEGRTPFMDVDKNYYPVPAFGTIDQPVFGGDINKFCHHIMSGKPLPGLSKRNWNNDVRPQLVVAATKNLEGKLGPWVVFAPLHDDAFDSMVIGEGGAYFRVRNHGPLGYGLVDVNNSEILSHILRCEESPLWFVPEEFLPDLRRDLRPVPEDEDILKDSGVEVNPFGMSEGNFVTKDDFFQLLNGKRDEETGEGVLDVIRKMNLKGKKPLEKMPEAQEGKKLKAECKADEVLKDAEKPRRANEGRGRKEAPRQEAPAKDAPKADPKPKAEVKAEAQKVMKAEVAASTRRSDKNKNETKEKENNKNRREVKEAPLLEAGKGPVKELEAPAAKEVKEIAKEAPKEAPRETAKDAAKEAPKDVKEAPKQETTAKETKGKNGKRDEAPAFTEKDFIDRLTDTASRAGLLYNQKDLINFHISAKSSRLVILAGMSGTGKSGLVRLYGKALGIPEERICFLPVRPSWMDDGDILGYVDMKNLVYRSADTGLAELLIDASQHTDKLYIVCFDEMNLARAEHYFAQFISALEKEGNPVIRLYNPSLAPRLYNGDRYPADITVGSNVIFTGTVNVDESTYHFSDKILDRANVITLHQGRFRDLMGLKRRKRARYDEIGAKMFSTFRVRGGLGLTERELDLLDALNDAFHDSGIQCGIGFRVARQMGRYLENIPEGFGFSRKEGIDSQVVQRILTKLRGSSQQLSILLSLNDKGELKGTVPAVLEKFSDLSNFEESKRVLKIKAGELKLYDYTI